MTELTAKTIVNEWPADQIARILFEYGEEKFSRRIAGVIVEARAKQPIETTGELVELIKEGIPAAARRTGGHPAKRSFQALRIAVNDELGAFEEALEQSLRCLAPQGTRCCYYLPLIRRSHMQTIFCEKCGKMYLSSGFSNVRLQEDRGLLN